MNQQSTPVNMATIADQIPFLELVEAQEVKKVRYRLLGGTPFAKTDIDEVREINVSMRSMCSTMSFRQISTKRVEGGLVAYCEVCR